MIWWYTYPSEKYDFVNWDDYSNYSHYGNIKFMFQTTNQLYISHGIISLVHV